VSVDPEKLENPDETPSPLSGGKSQFLKMPLPWAPDSAPMDALRDLFIKCHPDMPDPAIVFTQLSIPTNLAYLRDGLRRALQAQTRHRDELADCLRVIRNQSLDPEALGKSIQSLLKFIDERGLPDNDDRMLPMGRRDDNRNTHPLRNYCVNSHHYWCLLFYTLDPDSSDEAITAELSYEELVGDFSTYLLAAFSRLNHERYLGYSRARWTSPAWNPASPLHLLRARGLDDDSLASRAAQASLAMRRLSADNPKVFAALASPTEGNTLAARLYQALRRNGWEEADKQCLEAIARLIEVVRPGWHRPGSAADKRRRTSRTSVAPRVKTKPFEDGFVRIVGSDTLIQLKTKDETGSAVLIGDIAEDEDAEDSKWLPAIDRMVGQALEAIELPDEEIATSRAGRGVQSRWASDQLRKSYFALPRACGRLSIEEARAVVAAIHQIGKGRDLGKIQRAAAELAVVLAPVLVSIATGRSFTEAKKLYIAQSVSEAESAEAVIIYVREVNQWWLRADPPAWNTEKPVTIEVPGPPRLGEGPLSVVVERLVSESLHLPDVLGFSEFLSAWPGTVSGSYLSCKNMTLGRSQRLEAWLANVIGEEKVSLDSLSGLLFQQILRDSRGDVALADLISGQRHTHSGSARHYSHYRSERVSTVYINALRQLAPEHISPPKPVDVGRGHGARRVPSEYWVAELIKTLQTAKDEETQPERHNRFTLHTYAGLILGLGFRPVIDPRLIDVGSNKGTVVTFGDKLKSDYDRRLSVVPKIIEGQLKLYAAHIRNLRASDFLPAADNGTFYWWDSDKQGFVQYRPTHFEMATRTTFGLEAYALRRFMRTALAEEPDAVGEDIDCWMGHWFLRVSPHDSLSAYPFSRQAKFAAGPVSRIIERLGYRAMAGIP